MAYGLFQPSVLSMMSQSRAINTIGDNIANLNTVGFKGSETRFQSLLSRELDAEGDLGGTKPYEIQNISKQGTILSSARKLDVAISGNGFFMVSPTQAVSTEIYYTRDGAFEINVPGTTASATDDGGASITVNEGFLGDSNGNFLLGVAANADGTFPSNVTTLQTMRVDQFAFSSQFQATTNANLDLNLPSNLSITDDPPQFAASVIDSNGTERVLNFNFRQTATENQWIVDFTGDNLSNISTTQGSAFSLSTGTNASFAVSVGTGSSIRAFAPGNNTIGVAGAFQGLQAGDSITLAGSTGGNNGTYTIQSISDDFSQVNLTQNLTGSAEEIASGGSLTSTRVVNGPIIFSSNGFISSPTTLNVSATYSDNATSTIAFDISGFTQFGNDFTPFSYNQDGLGTANIEDITIDPGGVVVGTFDDGTVRSLYKIPIAQFANADGLRPLNGPLFEQSPESGTPNQRFVDATSSATLIAGALEGSNVDLEVQFSHMIIAQQVYNSSATAFTTVDEMTATARDLKR